MELNGDPAGLVAAVAMTVGGAVAAWQLWRCWSGRARRWAHQPALVLLVLSWGPFGAALLLGTGLFLLLGDPFGTALGGLLCLGGFAVLIPGLIYYLFRPRWWGPRWFRRTRGFPRDLGNPPTASPPR